MLHRFRAPCEARRPVDGKTRIDECCFGGRERKKHADRKLNAGRGTVGKTALGGIRRRESGNVQKVLSSIGRKTLHGIIERQHGRQTADVHDADWEGGA